jgi:hypothetical protein
MRLDVLRKYRPAELDPEGKAGSPTERVRNLTQETSTDTGRNSRVEFR